MGALCLVGIRPLRSLLGSLFGLGNGHVAMPAADTFPNGPILLRERLHAIRHGFWRSLLKGALRGSGLSSDLEEEKTLPLQSLCKRSLERQESS